MLKDFNIEELIELKEFIEQGLEQCKSVVELKRLLKKYGEIQDFISTAPDTIMQYFCKASIELSKMHEALEEKKIKDDRSFFQKVKEYDVMINAVNEEFGDFFRDRDNYYFRGRKYYFLDNIIVKKGSTDPWCIGYTFECVDAARKNLQMAYKRINQYEEQKAQLKQDLTSVTKEEGMGINN